jgi:hypothetical protein
LSSPADPPSIPDSAWHFRHFRRSDGTPLISFLRDARGHLLREHRIGDFHIRAGGAEVECVPLPGCPPAQVEDTFLFPVLPLVLSLRGIDGMHAAAVEMDGEILVFAGPSGAGKSTLAASLLARGLRALTDEHVILRRLDGARVGASAGISELRLRPDSFEDLGFDREPWDPFGEKRVISLVTDGEEPDESAIGQPALPLPIRRLYFLDRFEEVEPVVESRIEPLTGRSAFLRFIDLSFRLDPGDPTVLDRQSKLFARLINQDAVRLLRRPAGFEHLDETLDLILADGRAAAP